VKRKLHEQKCAEKTEDELQMNLVSNVCVSLVLIRFMFCLGVPNIQQSEVGLLSPRFSNMDEKDIY